MAYGDSRTSVAAETFDSSISANWDNGIGSFINMVWATGGHIEPSAEEADANLQYSAGSFEDDQYSEITIQTVGSQDAWIGGTARGNASDTRCYACYAVDAGGEQIYQIFEFDNSGGFTVLASSGGTSAPWASGDTATIEVEGTTIRLGSNEGAGDGQRLTTTDATLSAGRPGVGIWVNNDANAAQVTAADVGSIGAAGTAAPVFYHHYRMMKAA